MSLAIAGQLAHALMFEGYVLYPYRQDSLKNQKRVVFGSLYPAALAEASGQRSGVSAELLVAGDSVRIEVLFLHWARRVQPGSEARPWLEALERRVQLGPLLLTALANREELSSFAFPSAQWQRGDAAFSTQGVSGTLRASAERVSADVFRLQLRLQNRSALPSLPALDEASLAELMSFGAAHLLVQSAGGQMVSLLEPPPELAEAAAACRNDGVWPVLIGSADARDTMLASPITLYDFPVVAPESTGDYFDATEIDEMLALRVRTMTDAEKEQARLTDPRARQILERSEQLSDEQLSALHGAWRAPIAAAESGWPRPGDRVRLRPRPGRDVLDLALAGEVATVITREQDFEGRRYCTVTVDADPGRDLGALGQPGHRFFFDLEEVERLS
jgi:hypothetical protein